MISQNPTAGTAVDRGDTVTITVSTGVAEATVPNVVGLGPGDASRQLRAQRLVPVQRETDVTDPSQDGKVVDQRPAAGTSWRRAARS